MSSSYTFSTSGALSGGTRSALYTLPTEAQSVVYTITTAQTLGSYPLGALGTDLYVEMLSTHPDGFDPSGYTPVSTASFSTYPQVATGFSGECPGTQSVYSGAAPDTGSAVQTIAVGTPPPNTVVNFNVSGVTSAATLSGSSVTGVQQSSAAGNLCVWNSTTWPTSTGLNNILGIGISNDEGLSISYTITGTAYVNTGDTGEVIILDAVSPTYGQPIQLQGNNYGPIATAMQVSQDGGPFTSVFDFSSGTSWSGNGASGEYGTHTLQVQDAITLVQSNTVTYVLAQPTNTTFLGLFQSDVIPTPSSQYAEFGGAMLGIYETSLLPDNEHLFENCVIVTGLDMGFVGAAPVVSCRFFDASGSAVLGNVSIAPTSKNTIWGNFVWGKAPWGGTSQYYARNLVPWKSPIVFGQGYFQASVTLAEGFAIGALYMQYQELGYTQQLTTGVT